MNTSGINFTNSIEPNAGIIVKNGTTKRINLIVILLVSDLYIRQRNENKYGSRYWNPSN